MKTTQKELRTTLRKEKKVMVTRQYGTPIYISQSVDLQIRSTDKKEDAAIWDGFDGDNKLDFHRVVTGWELEWEYVN